MIYKAIIFDLDGTLLDTLADIASSMNSVLKSNGFPERPIENYRYYVGEGIARLVDNVLEDLPATDVQKDLLLQGMKGEYGKRFMYETNTYAGITELFSLLSTYGNSLQLGVFSNKPDILTKEMIKHYFPEIEFSQVRGAIDGVPKKPDPHAVFEMANIWNILPEEIIFIGDSNIDMQTAVNAGCFAAGALWGFRTAAELKENGAQILLQKPQDLLTVLA